MRLIRRFLRWVRSTASLFVSLAICAAAWAQDEEVVHFQDGKSERVRIVGLTKEKDAVLMRFRDIELPIPIRWSEIHPADAASLRLRLLGKEEARPPEGFAERGVRVRTDTATYEGLQLKGSPDDEIWIKNAKGRFVVKRDQVRQIQEIDLPLHQIHSGDELYDMLFMRAGPATAEDWDKFGAELVKAGLPARAIQAFEIAEKIRHPELPEGRIYRGLIRLRDDLHEVSRRKIVHQVQEQYLTGAYDGALELMDRLEKDLLSASLTREARELRRLREEVHLLRNLSKDQRVVAEWERVTEALLKSKAMDRRIAFAQAREYAERELPKEVEKIVARRLNMEEGDPSARLVWERRPIEIRKHDYGDSTWVVVRPERGDVELWWKETTDRLRYQLILGLAVEKHYDVRDVAEKGCPTCGGTGAVDPAQYPDSLDGRCPGCLGLRSQRVLIYR